MHSFLLTCFYIDWAVSCSVYCQCKRLLKIYFLQRNIIFVSSFLARLRGVHDGLFTGQIDAVDTLNATYRVTFDRTGLGTHTVPDYEVLVSFIYLFVLAPGMKKFFFQKYLVAYIFN